MISNEAIKVIANANQTAVAVFRSLVGRERCRRAVNITLLYQRLKQQGAAVVERDFYDLFQSLQEARIGHLVIGRGGNPDFFMWDYDLRDIAKAGVEGNVNHVRKFDAAKSHMRMMHNKRRSRKKVIEQQPVQSSDDKDFITIRIPRSMLSELNKH